MSSLLVTRGTGGGDPTTRESASAICEYGLELFPDVNRRIYGFSFDGTWPAYYGSLSARYDKCATEQIQKQTASKPDANPVQIDHESRYYCYVLLVRDYGKAPTSSPPSSPAPDATVEKTAPTCEEAQAVVQATIDGDEDAFYTFSDDYFDGDLPAANEWLAAECSLGFE